MRGTGSTTHLALRAQFETGRPVLTTEPVLMELLGGSGGRQSIEDVRRSLAACEQAPVSSPDDWIGAAAIYRACRRAGVTPRGFLDCVIAAVAIRWEAPILAHDRDFELIAQHTELRIAA